MVTRSTTWASWSVSCFTSTVIEFYILLNFLTIFKQPGYEKRVIWLELVKFIPDELSLLYFILLSFFFPWTYQKMPD